MDANELYNAVEDVNEKIVYQSADGECFDEEMHAQIYNLLLRVSAEDIDQCVVAETLRMILDI
jgi:hypothetical protein